MLLVWFIDLSGVWLSEFSATLDILDGSDNLVLSGSVLGIGALQNKTKFRPTNALKREWEMQTLPKGSTQAPPSDEIVPAATNSTPVLGPRVPSHSRVADSLATPDTGMVTMHWP